MMNALAILFRILLNFPTILVLIREISELVSKVSGDKSKDERKAVKALKAKCSKLDKCLKPRHDLVKD